MFISHILKRNARVEEDLADQLFNSTEKRLARLLLLLANFGKEGRAEPILSKISQDTLADPARVASPSGRRSSLESRHPPGHKCAVPRMTSRLAVGPPAQ